MKKSNKTKKVTDIYDLKSMEGVGDVTAKKLVEVGITNLCDIVVSNPVSLADLLDWDKEEAANLIAKSRIVLEQVGLVQKSYRSALDLLQERQNLKRITTGSKALDIFLKGGIETMALTEFYGEFGSGKTQLCHTLAVTVQLPEDRGGLGGKCLYVDTENTFRPERIVPIAKHYEIDIKTALDNIIVARAENTGHQVLILDAAGNEITNENVKLIVVDSIMGNFRPEFIGRANLSERQQLLNQHIHKITRLAEVYKVACVITNQALTSPDMFQGMKATGGNVIAHGTTYRIFLKKSGKKRVAKFVDSPYHVDSEVLFSVADYGITDAEDSKMPEIPDDVYEFLREEEEKAKLKKFVEGDDVDT